MKTENKYIRIVEMAHPGKTKRFDVVNRTGNYPIAEIRWYGNWRQYCIFPYDGMVFNSECLELIVGFLKGINIEHRKSWNQKKDES